MEEYLCQCVNLLYHFYLTMETIGNDPYYQWIKNNLKCFRKHSRKIKNPKTPSKRPWMPENQLRSWETLMCIDHWAVYDGPTKFWVNQSLSTCWPPMSWPIWPKIEFWIFLGLTWFSAYSYQISTIINWYYMIYIIIKIHGINIHTRSNAVFQKNNLRM